MTDDEKEFLRIAAIMNKRGHASEFAVESKSDRQVMERLTAQKWVEAMRKTFGITDIADPWINPEDPPDCWTEYQGRRLSVELTELVNDAILRAIARARKGGERISASDVLFDEAQWTPQLLRSRIDALIDSKNQTYLARQPQFVSDVLVIHTAERWLSPFLVSEWISQMQFAPRLAIKNTYLLMRYFPGYAEHWPLFKLYGSLFEPLALPP